MRSELEWIMWIDALLNCLADSGALCLDSRRCQDALNEFLRRRGPLEYEVAAGRNGEIYLVYTGSDEATMDLLEAWDAQRVAPLEKSLSLSLATVAGELSAPIHALPVEVVVPSGTHVQIKDEDGLCIAEVSR